MASFTGTADPDVLVGGIDNDTFEGLAGDDILTGGGGDDVFVYATRGFGADIITDFSTGDRIDLSALHVGSLLDLTPFLSQNGTDAVVTFGYDSQVETITLQNVSVANLTASNFVFYTPATPLTSDGTAQDDVIFGGGANDHLYGHDGNDVLAGGSGSDTLEGGVGDDIYYVDTREHLVLIDPTDPPAGEQLIPGDKIVELTDQGHDVVYTMTSYELPDNVEDLIVEEGAYPQSDYNIGETTLYSTGNALNNTITGNSARNYLQGMDGDDHLYGLGGSDTLDGGAGADVLVGGTGNDVYYIDEFDTIVENADEGIDTIVVGFSYTLTANFEGLGLTGTANINGTGNVYDNWLSGNAGDNILVGLEGNDTFSYGDGGKDVMIGGVGDDIYYIGNLTDQIIELSGEGTDTVYADVNYSLGAGQSIENFYLIAGARIGTGNELDNHLFGTWGGETLYGKAGDDVLDGMANDDVMYGGEGNDTYYVNTKGDKALEAAGEGIDTVFSSVTFGLSDNVENLILTGPGKIDGYGNASDNHLYGNGRANALTGKAGNDVLDGGADADTLMGGTGNDIYYVDNFHDVVVEYKNEGTDTVFSSVQYIMGGAYVENATLTGTLNSYVVGNALDNILFGNTGTNNLTGGAGNDRIDGGIGADGMRGGVGNDIYYVDNLGDFIVENKDEGTDLVYAWVNFNLGAQYIENLSLRGNANINGLGNNLANTIIGNSGNNTLDGRAGNDTLTGGGGTDIFLFTTGSGKDTITDFQASQNDSLNLHAYNQATALITQVGNDTFIDLGGGNIITLTGTLKADVVSHITW